MPVTIERPPRVRYEKLEFSPGAEPISAFRQDWIVPIWEIKCRQCGNIFDARHPEERICDICKR